MRRRVAELETAAARSREAEQARRASPEQRIFDAASGGTETTRTEQALKEREAELRSIFRAVPNGIGVVSNRMLVEVNDRVCQMTGYTVEELVGQSSRILYPSQEDFDYVGREKYRQITEKGSGTVLLVDDEESVRVVARKIMERCGFQVLTALDGREAIRIFRERASDIACVLLDLTMPHMDGEETLRELRRIRPDVPVILASGYSGEEISLRFAGQELAGFIEKPYQMGALTANLLEVMNSIRIP